MGLVPSATLPQAVSLPSTYRTLCAAVFPSERGSKITEPASKGKRQFCPPHTKYSIDVAASLSVSKDVGLEPCWNHGNSDVYWTPCVGVNSHLHPQPLPKPPRGRTLTYGPPEVFTLANVRELQDLLPLLAFPFALSSAPCRDGGQMSVDVGLVQGSKACVPSQGACPPHPTSRQLGGGSSRSSQ